MTVAIVPMSRLENAKSRLASVLPDVERERLVFTMFEDVLVALSVCPGIESTLVVTPDARISEHAVKLGVAVMCEDAQRGLNPAIVSAVACLRARGANRLLVVPGDIPLSPASELAAVVNALDAGADIVLVPDQDRLGTNTLAFAASLDFAPMFGSSSYPRHLAQARALGVAAREITLAGIGRDIDTPGDLDVLAKSAPGGRYGFLRQARRRVPTFHTGPLCRAVLHADSEETPT